MAVIVVQLCILPISQFIPIQPEMHEHSYPTSLLASAHSPPFLHGCGSQALSNKTQGYIMSDQANLTMELGS